MIMQRFKALLFILSLSLIAGVMFEREKTSKEEIIVIYDNSVYKAGLENDWGFSCVIKK